MYRSTLISTRCGAPNSCHADVEPAPRSRAGTGAGKSDARRGWLQSWRCSVRRPSCSVARNSTSRGCGIRCWPPSTSSVRAGDGRVLEQEAHGVRDVVRRRRRAQRRQRVQRRRTRSASSRPDAASGRAPRRTRARAAPAPAPAACVAASQRGLRQRVRQVVGVRVAQLLVEQVDDAAASRPARCARCACKACASTMAGAVLAAPVARPARRSRSWRRRRARTARRC